MRFLRLVLMGVAVSLPVAESGAQPVPAASLERARQAKTIDEALAALGAKAFEPGRQVLLEVPDIALRGQPVVVRVTSKLPGTDQMMLLAERRSPALLEFKEFQPGVDHAIQARDQFEQATRIRAVVRASGVYYVVNRELKVAVPVTP